MDQTRTPPPTLLLMKTKVIKSKFEDQEDTGTTPDKDADADAAADAVTPATPPHGGTAAAAGRLEPPRPQHCQWSCPQPWGHGCCKQAGGRGW